MRHALFGFFALTAIALPVLSGFADEVPPEMKLRDLMPGTKIIIKKPIVIERAVVNGHLQDTTQYFYQNGKRVDESEVKSPPPPKCIVNFHKRYPSQDPSHAQTLVLRKGTALSIGKVNPHDQTNAQMEISKQLRDGTKIGIWCTGYSSAYPVRVSDALHALGEDNIGFELADEQSGMYVYKQPGVDQDAAVKAVTPDGDSTTGKQVKGSPTGKSAH